MELLFLLILVALMIGALVSGFPVAFALPGSAIIAITLAGVCGWLFAGDSGAYFADGGPIEWLTAGVTNFRSLYWEAERDTLIAIPLFIFMGIMLQRSRIAEDLLVAMAQLFGPVRGGLGISVVVVGALLAATTGIVGATVVAMGMISLPAMLRNGYDKSLATGTISASGTLGQIIPPSIVLIILADQLSSAADQASTLRASEYRAATGEFSMPSHLDVVSASAGDMFMGAIIPGLLLVAIYIAYILITAYLKPKAAPAVPYDGAYDRTFLFDMIKALVPPLALIVIVLGSILTGVATVNQAGAIGAIGAILMGGYRIYKAEKNVYLPAGLALGGIIALGIVLSIWDINVKNLTTGGEQFAFALAVVLCLVVATGVFWSTWRVFKTENTLNEVMTETIKTTSMVFIILLGAAMLTAAFRAFGGEELVRHGLTSLPGGFWTQFIVVMLVIFLLGFFLDFIEIAVVVVPLVAPILLSAPDANVTAVWLGVMIGLNMQTSFLTPPFGFALFYLRGVAPKIVKTLDIYKGVLPFIGLQLVALIIVGLVPPLVNYLPNRAFLTSENAPPPMNPKLQQCLEEDVFAYYAENKPVIIAALDAMDNVDYSMLPDYYRGELETTLTSSRETFAKVSDVYAAQAALSEASVAYAPLHQSVRDLETSIGRLKTAKQQHEKLIDDARFDDKITDDDVKRAKDALQTIALEIQNLEAQIPANWAEENKAYQGLLKKLKFARLGYQNHVDNAYSPLQNVMSVIANPDRLASMQGSIEGMEFIILGSAADAAMDEIKLIEDALSDIPGSDEVLRLVKKGRRALRGKSPDTAKAVKFSNAAVAKLKQEVSWIRQANAQLLPALQTLDNELSKHIGVRLQDKLPKDLALSIASCRSAHRDVSLSF
ncbi:MAG: C4-dicarboxylate ABC transporter permease [Neptuniibacter caesariensis]|uniref:C4-dicarboxylate ABC transporter permease n=1 Tax=Neptuniibacter caesariensis TaxID=207954 RepID=A0A2G6JEI7_NEPCE|nr:MAG: C4-dicarboxylate ABC transporter permease [Neptuniibacter caesariensis]